MKASMFPAPRHPFFKFISQVPSRIYGHDEPNNDPSFLGIAIQVRKLDPPDYSNDVLGNIDGSASNENVLHSNWLRQVNIFCHSLPPVCGVSQ